MNSFNDDPLTPQDERILRDAVRSLPPLAPDAAFRSRVKSAFVKGAPAEAPVTPIGSRATRRPMVWLGGLAAAAVLVVALVSAMGSPAWTVNTERSSAVVLVNGVVVDPTQLPAIESGAVVVNSGPGSAWIEVADAIQCLIAPGTELRLDVEKGFLAPASLHAEITRGRLMAKTGPEFPGGGLTIDTDEAVIRITGTTFGVIKGPDSTCVCVIEGSVSATQSGEETALDVRAGERLNIYTPGRGTETFPLGPLSPMEREMTAALDGAAN